LSANRTLENPLATTRLNIFFEVQIDIEIIMGGKEEVDRIDFQTDLLRAIKTTSTVGAPPQIVIVPDRFPGFRLHVFWVFGSD
jgi:hypothetical protein